MPTYKYQCKACGHRLEVFQRMSDDALVECPNCEKLELGKLLSAPAFQLKGDGWYQTDFKDSGKKEAAKNETEKKDTTNNDTEKKASGNEAGGIPSEKPSAVSDNTASSDAS